MNKSQSKRDAVLELLEREGRPLHPREIAEALGLPATSLEGLERLLDSLTYEGHVVSKGGARVTIARGARAERAQRRSGGELREGTLSVNARGFGFVASPGHPGEDVFVPGEALAGGLHGDTVLVRVVGISARGAEGAIEDIVTRGTKRASGILRRRGKSAWVEPDDTRIRGPIVLVEARDGKAGEGNSGEDGMVVVVRFTRYPDSPHENPEGTLEAVLGRPGELSVEVKKALLLRDVAELHSEEAVAEAEAYGEEVPQEMREGREDLTHLPLPTIDPEDARDHDDAVWVERTAGGGYRATIAIADVSSYVRPGTKIDEEAQKRGVSVYLPDRAIPMLPRALSSNLCSLLPGVVRLCLAAIVELDASGKVVGTRLVRGVMNSRAKLTYGGVAKALGLTDQGKDQPEAVALLDGLKVALELSRLLRDKRMARGALDFELPEPKIELDAEGMPTNVVRRAQDPGMKKGYQLIEELMLLANEEVARFLVERRLPGIFRVHLPPDDEKLERLGALCETLGLAFDPLEAKEPKALGALLKRFATNPLAPVLNQLLLRSMKQATYDVANLGHFGLASQAYLHFTSPIRRYPDLVVHRVVHAVLQDDRKALVPMKEKMAEQALQSSQNERRAMEVEREVSDVYRCFAMIPRVGETFEGTVSAFVGSGCFVTLDEPFVDVLVRTEDLGPSFQIEDDGLSARATRSGERIFLGDRMTVTVTDVAILRRTTFARRLGGAAREADAETNAARRGAGPRGRGGRVVDAPERPRRGAKAGARGAKGARDEGRPERPARAGASKLGKKTKPSGTPPKAGKPKAGGGKAKAGKAKAGGKAKGGKRR